MWWLAKLSKSWRRPRGKRNKVRLERKAKVTQPTVGYGTPRAERGLHPSGLREFMVFNPSQVAGADPKSHVVRISAGVGTKKRLDIVKACDAKGLRVLNHGNAVREAMKKTDQKKAAVTK